MATKIIATWRVEYSKFKTVFSGTGCPKGCRGERGGAPNGSLGGRVLVSQLGLHSLALLKAKTVHLATLLKVRPFSMTLFGFISLHIQIYLSVFLS